MARHKGILKRKNKGLEVREGGGDGGKVKKRPLPSKYNGPALLKRYRDKDCEFDLNEEGSAIEKVFVDGKELPIDQDKLEQKQKEVEEREAKKKAEKERKEKKAEEAKRRKIEGPKKLDSFRLDKTLLPADTKALPIRNPDNFYLKFHKLARFDEKEEKFSFFNSGKGKDDLGYRIEAEFGDFGKEGTLKQLAERQESQAQALYGKKEVGYVRAEFEPEWRLIVGLGQSSVYEVSMTLHHVYGIPYIPGSAVKGVVRSWVILEYFDENEGKAIEDQGFCDLFGCPQEIKVKLKEQDGKEREEKTYLSFYENKKQKEKKLDESGFRKGCLNFFDAFPTKKPDVVPDVMNVHYKDYYGGDKPPADWQEPNPVFFLAVEGAPFAFTVGSVSMNSRSEGEEKLASQSELSKLKLKDKDGNPLELTHLNVAEKLLRDALEQHGIGAKTAVGYGHMAE